MRRRGRALRQRYGRAHRYGRAGHPLFPRLVMYLEKVNVGISEPAFIWVVKGKLQKHPNGEWQNVVYNEYDDVRRAREQLRLVGGVVAAERGVPLDHVEYVT